MAYLIVDEMHEEHPELVRDQFWDEAFPEMPYTAAAEQVRGAEPVIGAAEHVKVRERGSDQFRSFEAHLFLPFPTQISKRDSEFLPLVEEDEDDLEEGVGGGRRRDSR